MTTSSGSFQNFFSGLDTWLDRGIRHLSVWWLPFVVGILSVSALVLWPSLYNNTDPAPQTFRLVSAPTGQDWSPAQAREFAVKADVVSRWDSKLSEIPVWSLHDIPPATPQESRRPVLEFPSRHATGMACWNATTLEPLGLATHSGTQGALTSVRSGFALQLPSDATAVLCRSQFLGPARMTVKLWQPEDLRQANFEYHRNSGLLDGGMLVLAAFILIAGLVNRESHYLLFASWLVINLRMGALSAGWDGQWLGQTIPFDLLVRMRPITLGLYYVLTFYLFVSLFRQELEQVGYRFLTTLARWTCVPVLVFSVVLPYSTYLPFIWGVTGLGVASVVFLLTRILLQTRSRVALWYAASITVALFASLYEILSAALGLQGLIGAINSVTAALLSSLLASLAIAELMREEHLQRLEAQAKLQHTYAVIPIGLFTLDATGRFMSTNPALNGMLGKGFHVLEKCRWSDIFDTKSWQYLADHTASGEPVEMEVVTPSVFGEHKRLLVKAALAEGKIEGSLQDITEKARATENLQFLADHDPLTKALNRRGIEAMLQRSLHSLAHGQPLAVAYLDLDRFKLINDLYGHTAGDAVLQQVCARVQHPLNPSMYLGRVGGDEFLLVMENTALTRAETVCREIVASLSATPYKVGERAFHVRGSIGLIEVTQGSSSKDIVSTADRACREAKTTHGSGLVVYDKASRVFNEHEAELQLVERLSSGERIEGLFLEMQPIMSLRAPYESLNFEVLLRMHDDKGDRVPTDRLISAGENAGRMGVIDRWVLSSTLEWLRLNQTKLRHNQFVCMNLSGASLNDEHFKEDVYAMLDQHRDIATRVCLEITESVALHDTGNTKNFIDRVRSFGAKVALDDFGAGYTSFSYLKDLPADLLKIDGSFIVNMNHHPANIAIVEAIVSLAQNLGMKTIAEWAEDFETVETLAEIGVDFVQGFIVSRPQNPLNLLNATSSASFILDENLNRYLNSLAPENDELSNVDLVLGTPHTPNHTEA